MPLFNPGNALVRGSFPAYVVRLTRQCVGTHGGWPSHRRTCHRPRSVPCHPRHQRRLLIPHLPASFTSIVRSYGAYIWLLIVLGFAIYFGVNQRAELGRIRELTIGAERWWVVALVAVEIVILALIALTYRSLLERLGHKVRLVPLIGVHLQRVVVGTITPVGGPSSMLVFIHNLRQRGVRPADALLTVSIKSVISNIAFLTLLLPVLFVQQPNALLIAGTTGLVVLVLAMAGGLVIALRQAKPPAWLIHRLPRRGLRFMAQIRRHKLSYGSLIGPFALMLATKLGGVLMLFFALRAVGHDTDFRVPLMAYVVGMVFMLVAPIFQGIGFVEVSMALALQRLGVPPAAAIGATLLCRVGELWLPLVAGIALQTSETLSRRFGAAPGPLPSAP